MWMIQALLYTWRIILLKFFTAIYSKFWLRPRTWNGSVNTHTITYSLNFHGDLNSICYLRSTNTKQTLHFDLLYPPVGLFTIPSAGTLISFFQPIVQQWQSFIQDTTDFLNSITQLPTEDMADWWLCTIGISSLYTSIPLIEGLEAVEQALLRQDAIGAKKVFFIELLHFSLFHSYFQWQDVFFLQSNGTSMAFLELHHTRIFSWQNLKRILCSRMSNAATPNTVQTIYRLYFLNMERRSSQITTNHSNGQRARCTHKNHAPDWQTGNLLFDYQFG